MATYYTSSHEWISVEGNLGTVGITEYARKELGELVYVELPVINQKVTAGEAVCVLESTKAAVDVYSPMSGVVVAVNAEGCKENPAMVDWLFRIELSSPSDLHSLLSHDQYQAVLSPPL